jgi:hypothetical protein
MTTVRSSEADAATGTAGRPRQADAFVCAPGSWGPVAPDQLPAGHGRRHGPWSES